jgi:hypothetical protein
MEFLKMLLAFIFLTCIIYPIVAVAAIIWLPLWLIGHIFDIDSLKELGKFCDIIMSGGSNEPNRPN